MKKNAHIENILKEPILSITNIENGLTNDNYRVITKSYDVVLRMPKPGNEKLFDYALESQIIRAIQSLDIDVPLIHYDATTGIKIAKFIPNATLFQPHEIKRSAALLKKLHGANLETGVAFHLWDKYQLYKRYTSSFEFDLSPYEHFVKDAEDSITHRVLCHNDLVEGNFLFTSNHAYLIDYEYACDNDPYFDVMSLITENDIQDPSIREAFYIEYFGKKPDEAMQRKLDIFECAHYVLWCCWAQMMMSQDDNPVYQNIAALKYQRLMEFLDTQ